MKKILLTVAVAISGIFAFVSCGTNKKPATTAIKASDIYAFEVEDIEGNPFRMADLKGKRVMIVNVASNCGFTGQYEPLQKLYETYKDKDFVIIGFPANNFMGQEPGTNEEILEFCTSTYSVTFPMMSKISVTGSEQHPLYSWLTQQELNGIESSSVRWNFQKYLISEEGKLVGVAYSRESPDSERIIKWIEEGVSPGF